ncbi:hypothetical protein BGW38_000787 [Lunasporangiospora selenospora]|uniref:Peptide hydrolase n=1 Tax=Lunasporangiospora selenospora TaxID=979761 RepID=A0A9P6KHJ7_9FUNG|nr:hypothetical protein BGW38_000787 [Lunasporangiospora selenospora]
MIPRVSGTANNTLVQNFILDYFAKLNESSLAGEDFVIPTRPGVITGSSAANKKRNSHAESVNKLYRRAPGVPGTGWHVEVDRFEHNTPYGPRTFTNLVFTKNPNAENRLVFAAHYDSKYFPPSDDLSKVNGGDDTLPFVAATDSAAPCAILLDLAASLDAALDQPKRRSGTPEGDMETTLQIIFFDGEEAFDQWTHDDSLYGSKHLADKWLNRIVPRSRTATGRNGGSSSNYIEGIELFVLLDLLGAEGASIPNFFSSTQWAHRHAMSIEKRLWEAKMHGVQIMNKRQEQKAAGASVDEQSEVYEDLVNRGEDDDNMDDLDDDLPVDGFLTKGEAYWGSVDDDHRPFMHLGVPIFHVIPTPFPTVWHKLTDDASAIKPDVVDGWARIFRTFTVEYLNLLKPRERRHDEL